MSLLRQKLEDSKDLVFTAEFPSVDGGGMAGVEKIAARLAPGLMQLTPPIIQLLTPMPLIPLRPLQ